MSVLDEQNNEAHVEEVSREIYHQPRIIEYGTVHQLTSGDNPLGDTDAPGSGGTYT